MRLKRGEKRSYLIHNSSIHVLERVRELLEQGMQHKQVSDMLLTEEPFHVEGDHNEPTTEEMITKEQMQSFIEQQQQFNKELLDRLDRQQEYIDKRLNERDKDLMQGIREIQEQKQIAAAKEEENKRSWWKFW